MLTELFWEFLLIGTLSFGGGHGTLPLIEASAVQRHGWLTESQLCDLTAIAEVTPGPIALNAASFTGYTVCGTAGALAATLGCILPSCFITAVLAFTYSKHRTHPVFKSILAGIRITVCAMVFYASLSLLQPFLHPVSIPHIALFAAALILSFKKIIPPSALILLTGICGTLLGILT